MASIRQYGRHCETSFPSSSFETVVGTKLLGLLLTDIIAGYKLPRNSKHAVRKGISMRVFEGKIAIVTGVSAGIRGFCAVEFAKHDEDNRLLASGKRLNLSATTTTFELIVLALASKTVSSEGRAVADTRCKQPRRRIWQGYTKVRLQKTNLRVQRCSPVSRHTARF